MERSAERCEDLWRQKVGALVEWFMRPTISPPHHPLIRSITADWLWSRREEHLVVHHLHNLQVLNSSVIDVITYSLANHGHRINQFLHLASQALMAPHIEIDSFHPRFAAGRIILYIVWKDQAAD